MSDLERGWIIQDNDPRMPNRRLEILRFEAGRVTTHDHPVKAICRTINAYPREFRIDTRRIYSDGKPRKSGFSVVAREAKP